MVSGRTYPVDIRWRPLDDGDAADPSGFSQTRGGESESSDEPRDWLDGVADAVHELAAIDSGHILVFLPTERDIREADKRLSGQRYPAIRLSIPRKSYRCSGDCHRRIRTRSSGPIRIVELFWPPMSRNPLLRYPEFVTSLTPNGPHQPIFGAVPHAAIANRTNFEGVGESAGWSLRSSRTGCLHQTV